MWQRIFETWRVKLHTKDASWSNHIFSSIYTPRFLGSICCLAIENIRKRKTQHVYMDVLICILKIDHFEERGWEKRSLKIHKQIWSRSKISPENLFPKASNISWREEYPFGSGWYRSLYSTIFTSSHAKLSSEGLSCSFIIIMISWIITWRRSTWWGLKQKIREE